MQTKKNPPDFRTEIRTEIRRRSYGEIRQTQLHLVPLNITNTPYGPTLIVLSVLPLFMMQPKTR
eukprot:3135878-Amphidinium_carterae.1